MRLLDLATMASPGFRPIASAELAFSTQTFLRLFMGSKVVLSSSVFRYGVLLSFDMKGISQSLETSTDTKSTFSKENSLDPQLLAKARQPGIKEKKMKKVALILATVLWCPNLFAEYYLKFTATGASLGSNQKIYENGAGLLKVSIVENFPTDGPIHFKNSRIGSWTKYVNSSSGSKTAGVDNLNFYVADVPRSISIQNLVDGANTLITAGETPVDFDNAPAFLLEDGLVVAPGISDHGSGGPYEVYVAAAMPATAVTGSRSLDVDDFTQTDVRIANETCVEGWFQSGTRGDHIEIWQVVGESGSGNDCFSVSMYGGKISHVVRER